MCYDTIIEADSTLLNKFEFKDMPKPSEIKKELDKFIVGQDGAKDLLSVSAYNHYKRIATDVDIEGVEKSNILLMGSTGTGKTLLAKTLSKILGVPFAITDATALTEAGYAGEDSESVIERLLSIADFDQELAEKGIIYIDELDKKAKKSDSSVRDVSGEGVQQALLRLVEGTVVKVSKSLQSKKYADEFIEFDTSNVLFIVGGAFVGIEEIISKDLRGKSTIGFDAQVGKLRNNEVLKEVTQAHLIKYGIIPELIGRLPMLTTLDDLSVDQMVEVLTSVENNYLEQYKHLLKVDGIELTFSMQYIRTAAEMASKEKVGTRALKGIIENSLINIMFRAPDLKKKGVTEIIFDNYPDSDYCPALIYGSKKTVADKCYKLHRGKNEKQLPKA
jgi:ATP-dependent Clp protease ATP-binding subunit ClpX